VNPIPTEDSLSSQGRCHCADKLADTIAHDILCDVSHARSSHSGVVLAWCFWLLGSWVVTLVIESPVRGARWMIYSSLFGMMAVWPALKLSQVRSPMRIVPLEVLFDWISMMFVLQAVIWPLHLSTNWSLAQAMWLDAAIGAWSFFTAGIVAWGCSSPIGRHRLMAMVVCLVVLLGEPAAIGVIHLITAPGVGSAWVMRASPLQTIWALTSAPSAWSVGPWALQVMVIAIAGVVGWAVEGIIYKLVPIHGI